MSGDTTRKSMAARRRQNTEAPEADFRRDTVDTGRLPSWNKLFNPEALPLMAIKCDWQSDAVTSILPFPAISTQDERTILPARKSDIGKDIHDWARCLPVAKFVGLNPKKKVTYVLWDPRRVALGQCNPADNPYVALNRALRGLVDPPPWSKEKPPAVVRVGKKRIVVDDWRQALALKDYKKSALCYAGEQMQYCEQALFMQGFCYQRYKEIYVADGKPPLGARDGDPPVIFYGLGRSLVGAFKGDEPSKKNKNGTPGLLGMMKDGIEPDDVDPDSPDESFAIGNPVDIHQGTFLSFYNKLHDKHFDWLYEQLKQAGGVTDDPLPTHVDKNTTSAWHILASQKLLCFVGRSDLIVEDCLANHLETFYRQYVWFDDVIYIPSDEEQYLWLTQAFLDEHGGGPGVDMLMYAFDADYPQWRTPEVKRILASATSAAVDGMAPDDEVERGLRRRREEELDELESEGQDDGSSWEEDEMEDADEYGGREQRRSTSRTVSGLNLDDFGGEEEDWGDQDDVPFDGAPASESDGGDEDFDDDIQSIISQRAPQPDSDVGMTPPSSGVRGRRG